MAALKKQVSGLNDKLTSSNASFAKSKAKGKERKKKIKSLGKSLDNLHAEVARLSADLNQATILEAERDEEILRLKTTPPEFSSFFRGQFQGLVRKFLASDEFSRVKGNSFLWLLISEYAVEPLSVILQLELEKLVRLANVPTSRDARVSPLVAKELTVTPASKSLELSANVDSIASVVASEHNEEMVNAEVDGSDPKMTDDTIIAKFGHAFMQGMLVILDDIVELAGVGSGRVSSDLNDVVVSLFVGEEGDGLAPSSVAGEGAAVGPSGFRFSFSLFLRVVVHPADPESCHPPKAEWLPPGTFSIAGQVFIGSIGCILLSEADIILSCLALEFVWLLAR
ncbi:hypothetical protein Tco_0045301 [Tanacetum coccineum]